MAGGPEGDCCARGPKTKGKRARGWQLLFLSCFLCGAANRSEDRVEAGQGEHLQTQPTTHNIPNVSENPPNCLSAKEIKKKVKQGKARRKQQGKAWYTCFLKKPNSVSPINKLTKESAIAHTNDCSKGMTNAQDSYRLAEACLDAVLDKLERDRKRAIGHHSMQRSQKTLEANLMWSCLPLRPDNINRAVTFQEPVRQCKALTDITRKPSKRDLEWRRILDEVRREQLDKASEKKMQQEMQTKEPRWLTFLKGRCFDFKKDLTTLLLACAVFIFAWFSATTLSSTDMYHALE